MLIIEIFDNNHIWLTRWFFSDDKIGKDIKICRGNPIDDLLLRATKIFNKTFENPDYVEVGIKIVESLKKFVKNAFQKISEAELDKFFNYQLRQLLQQLNDQRDNVTHEDNQTEHTTEIKIISRALKPNKIVISSFEENSRIPEKSKYNKSGNVNTVKW